MRSKNRWVAAAAAAAAGLVLAGCPAPPPTPPSCPEPPSGVWFGSWDGSYDSGTVGADLQFSGSTVSGTATLQNSRGGTGAVSGTVDCERVTILVTSPGYGGTTFTGTISEDALGATISATYTNAAFTIPTTIPELPEQGRLLIGWTVDPEIPAG